MIVEDGLESIGALEETTYRLANDMWQVKHLNGLTLVSANDGSVNTIQDGGFKYSAHVLGCVVPNARPV